MTRLGENSTPRQPGSSTARSDPSSERGSLRRLVGPVVVVVYLLVVLIPLQQAADRYDRAYTTVVAGGTSTGVRLTVGRGADFRLGVRLPEDLDGKWSLPEPLMLTLDGYPGQLTVVPARPGDWPDKFTVDMQNPARDTVISGELSLPCALAREAATLGARLTGQIIYPKGLGLFTNQTVAVDVPLAITVDTGAARRANHVPDLELWFWVGEVLALGLSALTIEYIGWQRRRHRGAPSSGRFRPVGSALRFAVAFGGLALVVHLMHLARVLLAPATDGRSSLVIEQQVILAVTFALAVATPAFRIARENPPSSPQAPA